MGCFGLQLVEESQQLGLKGWVDLKLADFCGSNGFPSRDAVDPSWVGSIESQSIFKGGRAFSKARVS